VNGTFQFSDKAIWDVDISTPDGREETYRATGNHPFWIEADPATETEEGWVAVELLRPGNTLRLADGSAAVITHIENTGDIEPVYNFEVDGWHTYFIGKLGTWVHNTRCGQLQDGVRLVSPRSLIGRQTPSEFTGSTIKKVRRSIRRIGFDLNEVIDVAVVNGKRIIIDGHHRTRAAIAERVKEVPIRIHEVTREEGEILLQQAAEAFRYLG
jgi:hypothetical protein